MPPGRRIWGIGVVMSMTVDSTPIFVGPASNTMSILPARSLITCCASFGLGLPARFALGAAMGEPDSLMRARATLLLGILMAMVSKPTTVMSGTRLERFKMRVRGPGQNCPLGFLAFFLTF